MVDPDHLTHFWGPVGVSAPRDRITVDARPGGVFETLMVNDADGSEYPTRAVFDEVRAPELLVWTESHSGMRVRSEFVALGPDRTEVRIHQTYVPEAFLAPEFQAGFLSSLDRLEAYLAGLAPLDLGGDAPGERRAMTDHDGIEPGADLAAIAGEYTALADLLESAGPDVWDAPSLCEGWRTREVVAHMTMPARYPGPAFMAELEAAGGDFTRLSNTVAARDGALPVATLVADLRSDVLHGWQPPGGGMDGALTHCVIHELDIVEAVPLERRVPAARITRVLRARRRRGRAEHVRGRSRRRGAAGRRPGVVGRLGCAGDGTGAGARPRGLWPPAAGGPPGRRGSEPLHPVVNGRAAGAGRDSAGRRRRPGATPWRRGPRSASAARRGSPPARSPAPAKPRSRRDAAARLEA